MPYPKQPDDVPARYRKRFAGWKFQYTSSAHEVTVYDPKGNNYGKHQLVRGYRLSAEQCDEILADANSNPIP